MTLLSVPLMDLVQSNQGYRRSVNTIMTMLVTCRVRYNVHFVILWRISEHFSSEGLSMCSRLPVLLQGETSVGKTSLITYLARITGNKCHRINNHEHTDIQEYVGCYTASERSGRLVFNYGIF